MGKVIIETLSNQELEEIRVKQWPIWEKEVSCFDWYYETDEQCYIIDGEVNVKTKDGEFKIKAGDFVTFKKGLKCVWNVKKVIRKHYKFL